MRRYLAEFTGAFAPVFTGCSAIEVNNLHGGALPAATACRLIQGENRCTQEKETS